MQNVYIAYSHSLKLQLDGMWIIFRSLLLTNVTVHKKLTTVWQYNKSIVHIVSPVTGRYH